MRPPRSLRSRPPVGAVSAFGRPGGTEMNPPEAPSAPPPRGHRQRPGEAGSAAIAGVGRIHVIKVPLPGTEQLS